MKAQFVKATYVKVTCWKCNGSGEGITENHTCRICGGSGELEEEVEEEDEDSEE